MTDTIKLGKYELSPCPDCGSCDGVSVDREYMQCPEVEAQIIRLRCIICGYRTEGFDTLEEAVEEWNLQEYMSGFYCDVGMERSSPKASCFCGCGIGWCYSPEDAEQECKWYERKEDERQGNTIVIDDTCKHNKPLRSQGADR